VADRMSKNPATTVPQTPLPNVTYGVGGVAIIAGGNTIAGIGVSGALAAILTKNVLGPPSPKSNIE